MLSLFIYRQKQKVGKKKKPRKHNDEVACVRVTWEHNHIKITGTIPNQKKHHVFTLLIHNIISDIVRRKVTKFTTHTMAHVSVWPGV